MRKFIIKDVKARHFVALIFWKISLHYNKKNYTVMPNGHGQYLLNFGNNIPPQFKEKLT